MQTRIKPSCASGNVLSFYSGATFNRIGTYSPVLKDIPRAADFYGPETPNGLPNVLRFDQIAKNHKPSWLANDSVPHSYSYTPDAARSLVTLVENESAWNQTWHVATTPNPPTGKELIAMAAKELGVAPRYRVLNRPMVRLIGWFNPLVGEVYEMLYQNDSPYLF